jgi:hypothetical protein
MIKGSLGPIVLLSALPLCQGKNGGKANLFKAIENPKIS